MNNRIEELRQEYGFLPDTDLQEFAKVIVKECIDQMIQKQHQLTPTNQDPDIWKKFYAQNVLAEVIGNVRNLFGVEYDK